MRSSEYREEKKKEIMGKCYECYCENGLRDTGIKELGKYCGMTSANLIAYNHFIFSIYLHFDCGAG